MPLQKLVQWFPVVVQNLLSKKEQVELGKDQVDLHSMPGGGTAFGPSPRSFAQKVNKKMMLNAIETILIDKMQSGNLLVTEGFELTGKTKEVAIVYSNEKNCNNSYIVSKTMTLF